MAKTRVQFLAYVKRTFKRDDKDTEIYECLDETILDIASRHSFQILQFQSTVPVVAAQEDYPLPTNLLHFHHPVRYLEGSGTNAKGYTLRQLTKEEYDAYLANPNRTSPQTGQVWGYTIWSSEILLVEIPGTSAVSNGHLLEINWGKKPTPPTADGDAAQPWGDPWDETVKWGVLSRLYEELGMDAESEKFGQLYEVGKPIVIGGRVMSHQGGVANMIAVDLQTQEQPAFVANNPL